MNHTYCCARSYFFREYVVGMTKPLTWKIARNLYRASSAKAKWYIKNVAKAG